jgi:hypothetical protein
LVDWLIIAVFSRLHGCIIEDPAGYASVIFRLGKLLILLRIILERIGQVFTGTGRNDSFLVFSQVFAAPGELVGVRLGGWGWLVCSGAALGDTIWGAVPEGGGCVIEKVATWSNSLF